MIKFRWAWDCWVFGVTLPFNGIPRTLAFFIGPFQIYIIDFRR